jgi:hypothetical protein
MLFVPYTWSNKRAYSVKAGQKETLTPLWYIIPFHAYPGAACKICDSYRIDEIDSNPLIDHFSLTVKHFKFIDGWLVIYCFTSRSKFVHLYGDVTITGEGLQNLGLCSALRALEREVSLSCHTCCRTGPRFYRSHQKDGPIQSPRKIHNGIRRNYSNPDPHGSPFSCLLRNTMRRGGPILTQILTGLNSHFSKQPMIIVIHTAKQFCNTHTVILVQLNIPIVDDNKLIPSNERNTSILMQSKKESNKMYHI